jgi:hypothetical protein
MIRCKARIEIQRGIASGEKNMKTTKQILAALLLSAVMTHPASAATYGFGCITQANAADCAIGASQLFVDVEDAGANQVLFLFSNSGQEAASITDLYFADGSLLGIASVFNRSGVSFSQGASPPDLPGGNNVAPAFNTTVGFSADSNPPVQPNGLNPGESVGILFDLKSGKSFADTLNAIGLGGAPGGLRIGVHVQGFASGGSESFINSALPVPEASQWFMLLAGLGLIAARTLRRT